MVKNIPFGELLVDYGYINEEQLNSALEQQKNDQGKRRLGTILIDYGYITERQMLEVLAQRMQLSLIELQTFKVENELVGLLPKHIAEKHHSIIVAIKEGVLVVAINDPLDFYAQEDIRQITGMNIEIVLAEKAAIASAIEYYYSEVSAKIAAANANVSAEEIEIQSSDSTDDNDAHVIRLLNSLLIRGHSTGASDVHIEPYEKQTSVRMRLDGMLVDYVTLSASLHQSLIARIKILGDLDIAERRIPQDGHLKTRIDGIVMNIRVSVIPTVYGEKAVLRFLFTDAIVDNSNQFGMNDDSYSKVMHMMHSPNGIIYITGPTGSGKTTTLYMVLERMAQKQLNISTIEDPVERNLPRINQMQVNNLAGLTFESGLRALLRQDPDIIMVGETRDTQTANISVRSAITGHLVFSTLHTNDAVSTIVRLIDMGIEPYLISNSVVGVVAQRLIRKACPHCSYKEEPSIETKAIIGDIPLVTVAKGCHLCNNTGYKGRLAIHEIMINDTAVRKMVIEGDSIDNITAYAIEKQGMVPLRHSALKLVHDGITTVEEYMRVAYYYV